MVRFMREGNAAGLERVRRIGKYISLMNLALMAAILLVAALMQIPP
jgi:hypothetical protein